MKRSIVLIIFAICAVRLMAQFDPQIGQYMYIPTAYNPAAAGESDLMKVSGLHRMQFTGITGAPMTTYFTFNSAFVLGKTRHGAGVRFMNDRFGLFTNQTLHLQYAYRHPLGKGYLSAGVDLGFVNVGFEGDSVNLGTLTDEYHNGSDPLVPTGKQSGMGFDVGVGLYYTCPTWYAGVSYSHVNQTYVDWKSQTSVETTMGAKLRGTLYVHGGYNWQLRYHRDWVMKPSLMMMTDFSSWDVNVSWLVEYKERYRGGLTYRIAGNVGILLGVDIISGLQLGYEYELPTSKLLIESYGSHELYLSYGFNILRPKRTNRYKSVRYL